MFYICVARSRPPDPLRTICLRNSNILLFLIYLLAYLGEWTITTLRLPDGNPDIGKGGRSLPVAPRDLGF